MATHFNHPTLLECLGTLKVYHTRERIKKGSQQFRCAKEVTRTRGRVRDGDGEIEQILADIYRQVYLDYDQKIVGKREVDVDVLRIGIWGQCKALAALWSIARPETAPNIKNNRGLALEIIKHSRQTRLKKIQKTMLICGMN